MRNRLEHIMFVMLMVLGIVLVSIFNHEDMRLQARLSVAMRQVQLTVYQGTGKVSDFFNSFYQLFSLKKDYNQLKHEVKRLQGVEYSVLQLKKENVALRQLLRFSPPSQYQWMPAEILARDPESFFATLILNRGSNEGVEVGMPIVAYSAEEKRYGLIGRVIAVQSHTSNIRLLYDKKSHVGAMLDKLGTMGIVSGNGNLYQYATLEYIDKNIINSLRNGDLVVTSGFDDSQLTDQQRKQMYPSGLALGRIDSIKAEDYHASLSIQLKSIVNFATLTHVFIMLGEKTAL
jgi:rod shape-determining protein MreC